MENKTPAEEPITMLNKEEQRSVKNPICVITYKALPKIYGKKRDSARAKTQVAKPNKHIQTHQNPRSKRYFSQYQKRRKSSFTNKTKSRVRLSEPKNSSCCSKINCSCHASQTLASRHQSNFKLIKNIRLPEIQKFELADLQSQHKVLERGLTTQYSLKKTGLETIIQQQNEKTASLKNSSTQHVASNKIKEAMNIKQFKKINIDLMRSRYKRRAKINEAKSQIFEDSNEEIDSQESVTADRGGHTYSYQKQKVRMFSKSFLISKQRRQKVAGGTELMQRWANSHNKLLRIPEEHQYYEFIKEYVSSSKDFNLLNLVRSKGFAVLKDSDQIYFGQSDDANMHGLGVLITNKNIIEGKFINNLIVQGCEKNIDGMFIGKFSNGLRTGNGTFVWNNGEIFEGYWQNGKKNGFGIWRSPNGDQYEGQWFENRQHGNGKFQARRSTYTGEFKNFLKHGNGHQIFENGDIYKGQYKNGKPFGNGRYQWFEGGHYEGDFVQGMREGQGIWVDSRENKYEGSFIADFKHGMGKQTSSQGSVFEGQFFKGERVKGKSMGIDKQQ